MTEDEMAGWHHRLHGHEFDVASDLSSLLNKYHLLKDEFLSKLSELSKKIN